MKKYVCAILSFFENDIKQFKIEAESEYEAAKKLLIVSSTNDESKRAEIEWQKDSEYPQDLESLETALHNGDTVIAIMEVTEF